MSPARSEEILTEHLLAFRDPHERMAALVETCAGPGIPEGERRDADLVRGCTSRVWLCGGAEGGTLRLRWDAESALVRGLAGLLCGVYDGAEAASARAFRSGVVTALSLDRALSPTRLRGMAALESRIHELAARPEP